MCNRRAGRNFDNDPTNEVKVQGRAGSPVQCRLWFVSIINNSQSPSVFANIFDQLPIFPPIRPVPTAQDRTTIASYNSYVTWSLEPGRSPLLSLFCDCNDSDYWSAEYGWVVTAAIMPPHTLLMAAHCSLPTELRIFLESFRIYQLSSMTI